MSIRAKNITIAIVSVLIVVLMVATYLSEKSVRTNNSNKAQSNSTTNVSNTNANSQSNSNVEQKNSNNSQVNSSSNSQVNSGSNNQSNSNTNTNSSVNSNTNNSNSNVSSNTNQGSNSSLNSSSNLSSSTNNNNDKNVTASGTTNGKKIVVRNTCNGFVTQVIDEYYKDDRYVYYFNAGISGCVRVEVNGRDYSIKDAFNNKIVTPEEVEKIGYKLNKKSINTTTR